MQSFPWFARLDWPIVLPMVLLLTVGVVMISSVAPALAKQHLLLVGAGIGCYVLVSWVDVQLYKPLGKYLWVLAMLLLLSTALFGVVSRGSARWLEIGNLSIQTSELAKPLLIVAFASLLVKFPPRSLKNILLHSCVIGVPASLIFRQPDLGSAIVLLAIGAGMLFMAGVHIRFVLVALVLGGLLVPFSWGHLQEYQRQRVLTFLNPSVDPLGSGYSSIQSVIAVGSGQFFGRGLGRGVQSQLKFLPEHYTDFIFASLAEELGFLGSCALILLYGFLVYRCYRVSAEAGDVFAQLVVVGILVLILVQAAINIGMNMGIFPITGITLPFVSYGGSSLVSLSVCAGLVSSVARLGRRIDRTAQD